MKPSFFLLLVTLVTLGLGYVSAQEHLKGNSSAILLQGFHWESHLSESWWQVVSDKADDIAKSNFTMVWLPPSSAAASDEGYLPHQLYLQDSQYGSVAELKALIHKLHQKNVLSLADIVINHRVGTNDWADFTQPSWQSDAVCADDEWPGARGNHDTGESYHAARDIDHTQDYVRESIIVWMKWLQQDIGYDGWRYDYVKGFAGKYIGHYNKATEPKFSVGELWDYLNIDNPNAHRQQLCDWIDAHQGKSAAFDFTTKGMLQHAIAHNEFWRLRDEVGKPIGLIGWWPEKAVTFIDNHDTGPSTGGQGGQNHWPFPADKVMWGYAYILTHPGIPMVYWVHYYDWGLKEQIATLMKIRREQGITSTSGVVIQAADSSKYAAIIDGKVAVKIGPGSWSPGEDWKVATSGEGYALWVRSR